MISSRCTSWLTTLIVAGVLLAVASLSRAQAPTTDADQAVQARQIYTEALQEYQQGHFAEAVALAERANAMRPSAEALRLAGTANYELRRYVRSVELLQQALAQTEHALSDDRRASAEEQLQRSMRFVGYAQVEIRGTDASAATVTLDGHAVEVGDRIAVDVGSHEFVAHTDGDEPRSARQQVMIEAGETRTVSLDLTDLQAVRDAPTPALLAPETAPLRQDHQGHAALIAGTVGGVAVATILVVLAVVLARGGSGPSYVLPTDENTFGGQVRALEAE